MMHLFMMHLVMMHSVILIEKRDITVPNTSFTLEFNAKHAKLTLQMLILLEISLVMLYVFDHFFLGFGKEHHIFNLDEELTIPSWFSSMQLFSIGLLFLMQNFRSPPPKNISLNFLSLVGIGFLFLSLDETIAIHELMTYKLTHISWLPRFKNNMGLWIPIYAGIGSILLILSRQKIIQAWQFYRKELIIFTVGFLMVVMGGVILEIISYEFLRVDELKKWYLLEVTLEECLEMMGSSIMLYAGMLFTLH